MWMKFETSFKLILVMVGWGLSCEVALRWMSLDFTDDKSTLVQVMAWCRQATSHYLNQCWLRSMLPYGVTRPQWVKDVCNKLLVLTKTCLRPKYRDHFVNASSQWETALQCNVFAYWLGDSQNDPSKYQPYWSKLFFWCPPFVLRVDYTPAVGLAMWHHSNMR